MSPNPHGPNRFPPSRGYKKAFDPCFQNVGRKVETKVWVLEEIPSESTLLATSKMNKFKKSYFTNPANSNIEILDDHDSNQNLPHSVNNIFENILPVYDVNSNSKKHTQGDFLMKLIGDNFEYGWLHLPNAYIILAVG